MDYQSLEQQLIAAQNALEKDKLALARTIGLPLAQSFNLTDTAPYAPFDELDAAALIQQAKANRKDLAAMVEQSAAALEQRTLRHLVFGLTNEYGFSELLRGEVHVDDAIRPTPADNLWMITAGQCCAQAVLMLGKDALGDIFSQIGIAV